MYVIYRDFFGVSRSDQFKITPLGDIHCGNAGCDEGLLQQRVATIAEDPNHYTILMGDYCEFIKLKDRRWDRGNLAKWVRLEHLDDLVEAQFERVYGYLEPVADSTLAVLEGNHETAIRRRYEHDIYARLVRKLKAAASLPQDFMLGLGYTGWLILRFYASEYPERRTCRTVKVWLHHGFVGGALAGAKALNMQRILWSRDCDLALMGHSHNADMYRQAVERVRGKRIIREQRLGSFTGTFLGEDVWGRPAYYEEKGYFPLPVGTITVRLRPQAKDPRDRIRLEL